MAFRVPRGVVEALLFMLDRERSMDPRKRYVSSTALVKASGISWDDWLPFRHWLLERGLVEVRDGVVRAGVRQQMFCLSPQGRVTALGFERGVRDAYHLEPRAVPPPPPQPDRNGKRKAR